MFSFELRLQLTLISKPLSFLDMVGAREGGAWCCSLPCSPQGKLKSAGQLLEMLHENGRPLVALWFGSINIHQLPTICQALCSGLGISKRSGPSLGLSYLVKETVTQTWGVHMLGLRYTHKVAPDRMLLKPPASMVSSPLASLPQSSCATI